MHLVLAQLAEPNTWIVAAIGAVGAIFGALAGGLATYMIERSKDKDINIQRRQQAYSQLNGRKATYVQSIVSYYMNFIALEYSYAIRDFGMRIPGRITIDGKEYLTKSIVFDPQTLKMFLNKSDELALKLAQSRQDVWEVIGLIKLLFTNTDAMIKDIDDFDKKLVIFEDELKSDKEKGLIEVTYELLPHDRLDITSSWPKIKEAKLREDYIKIFDKKFDDLLDYLKSQIQAEQESAKKKHWWQFWR